MAPVEPSLQPQPSPSVMLKHKPECSDDESHWVQVYICHRPHKLFLTAVMSCKQLLVLKAALSVAQDAREVTCLSYLGSNRLLPIKWSACNGVRVISSIGMLQMQAGFNFLSSGAVVMASASFSNAAHVTLAVMGAHMVGGFLLTVQTLGNFAYCLFVVWRGRSLARRSAPEPVMHHDSSHHNTAEEDAARAAG